MSTPGRWAVMLGVGAAAIGAVVAWSITLSGLKKPGLMAHSGATPTLTPSRVADQRLAAALSHEQDSGSMLWQPPGMRLPDTMMPGGTPAEEEEDRGGQTVPYSIIVVPPRGTMVSMPELERGSHARMPMVAPPLAFQGGNSAPPPETKPGPAPAPESSGAGKPGAPAKPPSLDELLGIKPKGTPAPARPADPGKPASESAQPAPDRGAEDLARALEGKTEGDPFEAAVEFMNRSAVRLNQHGDSGIDTQRLQEDALRRLDAILSQMQKQKQQSSSQQQPQQQQQQQDQGGQPKQKQNQAPRSSEQRANESTSVNAPGRKDGSLRPTLDTARAAWGALPQRIREMLLQGSGEKFSQTYERMTEEYYQRLAEQKP